MWNGRIGGVIRAGIGVHGYCPEYRVKILGKIFGRVYDNSRIKDDFLMLLFFIGLVSG